MGLLDQARITYRWLDDPFVAVWRKFVFIAAFGLVTASQDKTLGEVLASIALSRQVKDIMAEIFGIARKRQVDLPQTKCGNLKNIPLFLRPV